MYQYRRQYNSSLTVSEKSLITSYSPCHAGDVSLQAIDCTGNDHTQTYTIIHLDAVPPTRVVFLQRVRIARNAERCNSHRGILSVRPSVRHVPVLCTDE